MEDRGLKDCRRTVMQTAAAIRLLREDRATDGATVYRSVFSDGVYVGRGLDKLARSVDRVLRRGWKTAGEAQERGGRPAGAMEEWFTYEGVRFYRLVPRQEWGDAPLEEGET